VDGQDLVDLFCEPSVLEEAEGEPSSGVGVEDKELGKGELSTIIAKQG